MPTFPLVTCAADWHTFCNAAETWAGMPSFTVRYIPREDGRHWCIDFPNGYTLSVRQGGYGSYSDSTSVELYAYRNSTSHAAWDDVRSYQDLEELAHAIKEVSRY